MSALNENALAPSCATAPFLSLFGNLFSSVAVVVANKSLVMNDHFKYMTVLTGCHFYFSFLVCCAMVGLGLTRYKPVYNYLAILRISLASLASIICMNFNLASNSVVAYQISKLTCIPVTLLLERLVGMPRQKLSFLLIISLVLIAFGVMLVAVREREVSLQLSTEGFGWACLAVLFTSIAQVFFAPLQKGLGLNALQLLFHTSPWITFAAFAMVPVIEDTKELLDFEVTNSVIVNLVSSCFVSVCLNTTNYIVLGWASPLTYQVFGHLKTILIIASGGFFLDTRPLDGKAIVGVILALTGAIIYSEEVRSHNNVNRGDVKIGPDSTNKAADISPCHIQSNYDPEAEANI